MSSQPRGNVIIDDEECKGCGLCVESCPPECLELAPELNKYGVHPAQYTGEDCTGCGACYYCCPEPGAITVERADATAENRGCSTAASRRWPMRQLCKGNVAIVKGAVLAGCKAFYGYPITPASEIAEYAALLIPEVGGTFLQAESEVSAINMVYGAASARAARDERVVRTRPEPDAGRHLLHGGRRTARRDRRRRTRRTGPGQHRSRAERLLLRGEGRRPRLLSQPRSGAGVGAGDVRPDGAGLRSRRPLSQSGGHHDRRLCRPDDGAARDQDARNRAAGKRLGGEGHAGDARRT